jgi:hypothetical protein
MRPASTASLTAAAVALVLIRVPLRERRQCGTGESDAVLVPFVSASGSTVIALVAPARIIHIPEP